MSEIRRIGYSSRSRSQISWKPVGRNLVTIVFSLIVLWGCSNLVGCGPTSGCEPFEYGVCKADSIVANYILNDTSFADADISARLWLGCAYTYNSNWANGIGSGIDCFDPSTPVTEWESQNWGIYLYFDRLGNAEGCGDSSDTAKTSVEIVFNVSSGLPREGSTFDVITAFSSYVITEAWDAAYEVTGGQVVINTATSGEYSYEIKNLTLTKTEDHDNPDFSECDTPDAIRIESVSATCEPTTDETCSC